MPYALLASVLIALGAAAAAPCAERMYQWTDPATGHTHLSGQPPHWYRNGDGPRVLVFEGGRLIDDTARPVDPVTGTRLRAEADGQPAGDDGAVAGAAATNAPPATPPAEDDAARVARLKALIAAWEALRTAEARAALGEDRAAQADGAPDTGAAASRRTAPATGPADPSAADGPDRPAR